MKRIESLVPGEHLTPQTGSGTELAMIRPYLPGDDVRHIDWMATARLQEPHVRVHVGERALTTWLVLDVSASMAFGTADRRKADVAEGVALAVGHVATRRGNRLGVLAFGGGEPRIMRPRQGRLGLLALLAELRREPEGEGAGATSLGTALGSAAALGRQRGLVVIVSDFRGERDWEGPLQALRARHGVMAVEIVDPREQQLVNAGDLWLVDPETGRQVHVDTRKRRIRDRFAAAAAAEREEVRSALRRAGADHVELSTGGDWLRIFASHLRRGEAALRAGAPARAAIAQPHQGAGMTPPLAVSFAEPILLAGFILVPLAVLAYGSLQRRRQRESAAWANPALVPGLTTARPGLAAPSPAVPAPAGAVRARVRAGAPAAHRRGAAAAANIVMVTDVSGSMNATDVQPDRLEAAVAAAKTLTEKVPPTFRLGLVTFSDFAEQRVAPTTDRSQIKGALDQLVAEGGTAMGDGLERGLFAARTPVPNADGSGVRRLPSVIVLLSDGKNTSGTQRADRHRPRGRSRPHPDLRDRARHARRAGRAARLVRLPAARAGPAGHRDAEGDRAALGRQVLHRHRDRQGQGDLRQPRHAALLQEREARGHRRVRGRRDRAADRRRQPLAALVRPAHLIFDLGQNRAATARNVSQVNETRPVCSRQWWLSCTR